MATVSIPTAVPKVVLAARRHLIAVQISIDVAAWWIGLAVTTVARYEFDLSAVNWLGLLLVVLLATVLQPLLGYSIGLYRRRWNFGSFDEVRALALTAGLVGLVLVIVAIAGGGRLVPRSVPFLATFMALVLMAAVRYGWRLYEERQRRPGADGAVRLIVFGAGEGGTQALRAMLRNPTSPYLPLALVDDDPGKRHLRLFGIRVQGSSDDLVDVARRFDADAVLIAIPSASSEVLRRSSDAAKAADLGVLVLPAVDQLFGSVGLSDIRPLTEEDLLGRDTADIDVKAIAGFLTNRRVLVTGAGGSIGSELCRQIAAFDPAELIMLDRDESGLLAVQLALQGRALLDDPNLVLADVRDRDTLTAVFAERRPDVVFHAAALKHLALLESHPEEAWKTNVLGTQHVLDAALAAGVRRFVNISTDKAAEPASVLGYSKRITERLTAHAAEAAGRPYVSVRFGNVLRSRGSMLGVFETQIAAGGPVTVTHRDVTRYFMTVQEAVRLTIQAATIGRPGEVLVLDMGSPVRIADMARRLVDQSQSDVEIVFTGLRPGEKLHEVLLATDEADVRPCHPLITQVPVAALDPSTMPTNGGSLLRALAVSEPSLGRRP